MSKRFLSAKITDKKDITNNGFLRTRAALTRVGVFKYRDKSGNIIRELRHPDDVFEPESLRSLEMLPLTNNHPLEFVNPENLKALTIGWVGEKIDNDGTLIESEVVVADAMAIRDVNRGKAELSCGYTADLEPEEGIFNGEPYDFRQKNIRYNHVALVDRGRAGPQVRLRLDCDDAIEDIIEIKNDNNPDPIGGNEMKKIILDGVEYEVSESFFKAYEVAEKKRKDAEENEMVGKDAMEKLQDEKKSLVDENKALKDEIEKLKKDMAKNNKEDSVDKSELDKMQARIDALTEKLSNNTSADVINKAVEERRKIEDTAMKVLGTDFKKDLSNEELKKATIVKHSPKCDVAEKSEDYINARFDSICEEVEGLDSRKHQLAAKVKKGDNADDIDAEKAKEKARQDSQDQWKQPLSSMKK